MKSVVQFHSESKNNRDYNYLPQIQTTTNENIKREGLLPNQKESNKKEKTKLQIKMPERWKKEGDNGTNYESSIKKPVKTEINNKKFRLINNNSPKLFMKINENFNKNFDKNQIERKDKKVLGLTTKQKIEMRKVFMRTLQRNLVKRK